MPTKIETAHAMLDLAGVTAKDVVYDLGSGDGILPIEAAKRYGVPSYGIEYNSDLVALSERNAKREGVEHLTRFKRGDIFAEDFSRATVVTLYLGEALNSRLMPKLLEMPAGTRVVSNTFRMDAWMPDKEIILPSGDQAYLWIVPAAVSGRWRLHGPPGLEGGLLFINQKKQLFDGRIELNKSRSFLIDAGRLRGNVIQFEFLDDQKNRYQFTGEVINQELVGRFEQPSIGSVTFKKAFSIEKTR